MNNTVSRFIQWGLIFFVFIALVACSKEDESAQEPVEQPQAEAPAVPDNGKNNTDASKKTDDGEMEKKAGDSETLPKNNLPDSKTDQANLQKGEVPSKVLSGLPKYFTLAGAIDDGQIVGNSQGKPFSYSLNDNSYRILSDINAWNLWLSPDKSKLAYNNEEGIGTIDLSSGEAKLVFSREDIVRLTNKNGVSPDPDSGSVYPQWGYHSDFMIIREEHEWDSTYYLLNLDDMKAEQWNTTLDGYFWKGAAILVQKALGLIDDLSAYKNSLGEGKRYIPNTQSHQAYQSLYKIYEEVYASLEPSFNKISDFQTD